MSDYCFLRKIWYFRCIFIYLRKILKYFIYFIGFQVLQQGCLESFQIVWKHSKVSENFLEFLETFSDRPKKFQSFWTLFQNCNSVRKVSRVSEKFHKVTAFSHIFNTKTFQIKKVSIKQCLDAWNHFLTLNYPESVYYF